MNAAWFLINFHSCFNIVRVICGICDIYNIYRIVYIYMMIYTHVSIIPTRGITHFQCGFVKKKNHFILLNSKRFFCLWLTWNKLAVLFIKNVFYIQKTRGGIKVFFLRESIAIEIFAITLTAAEMLSIVNYKWETRESARKHNNNELQNTQQQKKVNENNRNWKEAR